MSKKNFFAHYVSGLDLEMAGTDCEEQLITAASSQQFASAADSIVPIAILTCKCMENARVDIAKHIGFSERETHIVYTHGGQATQDAIFALIDSSKLLGTREWYIVHYTDCDKAFSLDDFAHNSNNNRESDHPVDKGCDSMSMHTPTPRSHKQRLAKHARRIRHHPLVPRDIPVHGCLYNGKTGNLLRVSTNLRQPLHLTLE